MILLDTNVVSELMLPGADASVISWTDRQPASSLWITAVTEMEIRFGILALPAGRRRDNLAMEFERFVANMILDHVATFDVAAARKAAELMAEGKRRGRPGELRDTMMAGIALATNATIATRNVAHFADLDLRIVNPWEPS